MKTKTLIVLVLLSRILTAQDKLERITAPVDAATLAVADLNSLSSFDQPFIRYIWLPPWISSGYAIGSQFINEVLSRNPNIVPARVISRQGVTLIRLDIRTYAPAPQDQQEVIQIWDLLESIYFPFKQATLDTFDGQAALQKNLEVSQGLRLGPARIEMEFLRGDQRVRRGFVDCEIVAFDEARKMASYVCYYQKKRYTGWTSVNNFRQGPTQKALQPTPSAGAVTLQNAQLAHLGLLGQTLPELTQSAVPIIRLDVLIRQGYTSLDTDRFQGLYYKFVGLEGLDGTTLTLNELMDVLGVLPQANNLTRIPILRSQVTGLDRIVDYLTGNTVRPSAGLGRFVITHDPAVDTRGVSWLDDHDEFIRLAQGHEVIFDRPNGTHGYAIFQGQQLLDSVPDVIADNHKIRAPHNDRLFAGVGCIYCHSAQPRTNGSIRGVNDNYSLLSNSSEYRAFIEQLELLGKNGEQDIETIQRVQTLGDNLQPTGVPLFDNDFSGIETFASQFGDEDFWNVPIDQQFYDRAIRRATFVDSKVAAYAMVSMWNDYEFELVTAQVVARDLGFGVPGGQEGVIKLQQLFGVPLGYEDPVFSAIKIGKGINRGLWEVKFPLAARRTFSALMLK